MRALLCAAIVFSSVGLAEAQAKAPLHNAGRAVVHLGHKIRHSYRAKKHYVKYKWKYRHAHH